MSSHKNLSAARTMHEIGAWFLFLPPYSPNLNPIEMAFSKLKALLRKAAAQTYEDLRQAVGRVCDLISDQECYSFFGAAGYKANQLQPAIVSAWLPRVSTSDAASSNNTSALQLKITA